MNAVYENPDKTRRAVVGGKKVVFYTRQKRKEVYRPPVQVWHQSYDTRKLAEEAASLWVSGGTVLQMGSQA